MKSFNTVVKRSGEEVAFDQEKIENAVAKAFVATGEVEARDLSTMSRLSTGRTPGMPRQTGQTLVLAAASSDSLRQEQNILLFVFSSACISKPIIVEYSIF